MELTKQSTELSEIKGSNMPLHTLSEPVKLELTKAIMHYLIKIIGVDVSKNPLKLSAVESMIEENARRLSPFQIKTAFDMYVKGSLPKLEPISGLLDSITFNKVIKAYKESESPKIDLKSICVATQQHFIKHKSLQEELEEKKLVPIKGVVETFDYLYEKGVLPKKDLDENTQKAYSNKMKIAKGYVYGWFLDKKLWLEKNDLEDVPKHKEIETVLQEIKTGDHPEIMPKFKQLVLEGFFKKTEINLKNAL